MSAGKATGGVLNRALDWIIIFVLIVALSVFMKACTPAQASKGGSNILWSIGVGIGAFIVGIPNLFSGVNAVPGGGGGSVPAPPAAPQTQRPAPKATQAPANPAAPKPKAAKPAPVPAKKPAAKTTAGVPA